MQRKFITNLAFLILLNLLVKPFWILIDIQVQNQVGEEDFGIYFAILSFTFLFNVLPDLGIASFNKRNIAMHHQLFQKHFSALVSVKFLLGITYLAVIASIGLVIGYDWVRMEFLLWLGINQFFISFIEYQRSNLGGLHLFKQESIISVLDRLLMIVICSVLLWGGITQQPFNIYWFVYLQTAAYGITALIAFLLVYRKAKHFRFKINWPFTFVILKQSLPFALLFILMSFYNRTDSVMIERLLTDEGPEQAGIYAKGVRLLDAVNMFALLFASLLLPIFARMIKLKQALGELVALSFKILIALALVGAVGCFIYSDQIMDLLYVTRAAEAAPIFQLLMFSFLSICTIYIFGTLLTANHNLKALNSIAFGGVILNIVLNFILIPSLKAEGAALASVVTQSLTAIAQVIAAQYFFRFRVNYTLIFRIAFFVVGLVALGYFSNQFAINWLYRFCGFVLVGGLWAVLTGMISLKGLYRIVKSEE